MFASNTLTYIQILVPIFILVSGGAALYKYKSSSDNKSFSTDAKKTSPTIDLPATLQERLGKTRGVFASTFVKIKGKSTIDPSFWEGIEEMLLLADVGLDTATEIINRSKEECDNEKVSQVGIALDVVKAKTRSIFQGDREANASSSPSVWLFVGVNGVGKTTSIAKIASRYRSENKTVLLVAGDTFRAAAADQLEAWANRIDADIVRAGEGSDPASVVFDGMEKANAKKYDVVLVDTAGRLHTKSNLMEEVKKIKRVVERTKDVLKEVLIVIDATTGQNGLVQAREFGTAIGVTGVILSKLDGSAKGGIALAIENELHVPIKWVGLGEGAQDLVPFNPDEYVEALFA